MTEQEQLSLSYSDLKDHYCLLKRLYAQAKADLHQAREDRKNFAEMYWQVKDELNTIIRGREYPEPEKI